MIRKSLYIYTTKYRRWNKVTFLPISKKNGIWNFGELQNQNFQSSNYQTSPVSYTLLLTPNNYVKDGSYLENGQSTVNSKIQRISCISSSIGESSNMEDLTNINVRDIINDHNVTHEDNTIKQCFHSIVGDESTTSQRKSSNDYKWKKLNTS